MNCLFRACRYIIMLSCMIVSAVDLLQAEDISAHKNECRNNDASYVCFDKKLSNIKLVINALSVLDSDKNSPVQELKKYIEAGNELALLQEVLPVLEYADWFLGQYHDKEIQQLIGGQLKQVTKHVLNGELDVHENDVKRSSDMRLTVNSKARFKEDVRMDKKLYVHGKARFYDDAIFKDDVTVEDSLVVVGELIVNGASVHNNINVGSATSDSLSVIDAVIDNATIDTLSVIDAVIDNATIDSLSSTDVNISRLSADDATIDSLSSTDVNMTHLSAVDGNITHLSSSDAIIDSISAGFLIAINIEAGGLTVEDCIVDNLSASDAVVGCNLNVGCNLIMQDSTTTVGNIIKGTEKFIHNSGTDNTFVGLSAGNSVTTGQHNVGFGTEALESITTASSNTALGYQALTGTSGSQNVAVGAGAGASLTQGDNNIYIGSGVSAVMESDTIRIGNGQTKTVVAGIWNGSSTHPGSVVFVDSFGQIGTGVSSKRFKNSIESITNESSRIYELNPVKFVYNNDVTAVKRYGLIAEEVNKVFPELVINELDGTPRSVSYEVLPVLLLNEMRKQQQEIKDLSDDVAIIKENTVMRSSDMRFIIKSKARFKDDVRMDKKLYVQGKAHFDDDVVFKDAVRVKNNVVIGGDLMVDGIVSAQDTVLTNVMITNLTATNSNVTNQMLGSATVANELSATDAVIACNLSVGCNINMVASTSNTGNITKPDVTVPNHVALFMHNLGSFNTALGSKALEVVGSGASNTAVGFQALASNVDGSSNTACGRNSLSGNTSGENNTAVGMFALNASVAGNNNTAVGQAALQKSTDDNNTAVGYHALMGTIGGHDNTALGLQALENNTNSFNTAIGAIALNGNTSGRENTAVGASALNANHSGSFNTAVGRGALFSNTTDNNVAVGYQALQLNSFGSGNTALGTQSLILVTTGSENIAVGHSAGPAVTTGSNNICIGSNTGSALTTGMKNIYIGNSVAGAASENGIIRIGSSDNSAGTFVAGIAGTSLGVGAVPVFVDTNGQLGIGTSSRRFKRAIAKMDSESMRIYDLNPVKFVYKNDETEAQQYGLIAEEVQNAFPELVMHEKDGTPLSVRYDILPVLLLNEMQKLAARVEALEHMIAV